MISIFWILIQSFGSSCVAVVTSRNGGDMGQRFSGPKALALMARRRRYIVREPESSLTAKLGTECTFFLLKVVDHGRPADNG
jgi:hypothetical protein